MVGKIIAKSALQIHSRSSCHLAASCMYLFFTFNLIYLYSFFDVQNNIAKFIRFFFFFEFNFNSNKRPFHFALQHYGYVSFCPVGNSFFTNKC